MALRRGRQWTGTKTKEAINTGHFARTNTLQTKEPETTELRPGTESKTELDRKTRLKADRLTVL